MHREDETLLVTYASLGEYLEQRKGEVNLGDGSLTLDPFLGLSWGCRREKTDVAKDREMEILMLDWALG